MARDHAPRERQRQHLARKLGRRASHDRILIVTEGTKTEPLQVVHAQRLFEEGDARHGLQPRAFEQVFAVFDRDEHRSYRDALARAQELDGKLRNDNRQAVRFKAVASVPSFELWLLLHFEEVLAPLHRDEVMRRLKRHLPGYDKGAGGAFAATRHELDQALARAARLAARFSAETDPEPFTGVAELVGVLMALNA
jgi:hypothetical protein